MNITIEIISIIIYLDCILPLSNNLVLEYSFKYLIEYSTIHHHHHHHHQEFLAEESYLCVQIQTIIISYLLYNTSIVLHSLISLHVICHTKPKHPHEPSLESLYDILPHSL